MEPGDGIAHESGLRHLPATMTSFIGPMRRGAFLELVGLPVVPLLQSWSFIYHHGAPPEASNSRMSKDETDEDQL